MPWKCFIDLENAYDKRQQEKLFKSQMTNV